MTRRFWTNLLLGIAVLTGPAVLLGCTEETPKPAEGTPPAPAPGPADTSKGGAPAAPGAPGK
jgi:hypothetical protein